MDDHPTTPPETGPAHKTAHEDRVPVFQKVAYGLGSTIDMWGNWLYPTFAWVVFNIYLHVPPWLVSTALCLNRVFDAISDPAFGWLSDNTRTRWGRRRPYILIGSVLAGIFLPCLVWVAPGWGSVEIFGREIPNYFWYMAASSAFYITIVSCFNIPWQSLGTELTPDSRERTSVFAFKSGIQKLPEIGLFAAGAFATAKVWNDATWSDVPARLSLMASRTAQWFSDVFASLFALEGGRLSDLLGNPFNWATPMEGETNILLGAKVYTMILGAGMIIVGVIVFLFVRERYYGKVVERKQEKIAITDTIWKTLKCRPFRAQMAMAVAYALGTSMVGTLGYYATIYYVCAGDVTVGSLWNFWMGLANTFIGFFGVPTYAFIANRLGKKRAMMVVQLCAMFVFFSTWWLYDPEIRWLQLLASGFIAFTGVGFWVLDGSIRADVMDYDELEHGKRREGAFTATQQWILKFGQALGILFSGIILSATGFDASLGGAQSEQALFNIRFYLAAIPIVGLIIALIALSRLGLTDRKVAEIRAQLEARRGRV